MNTLQQGEAMKFILAGLTYDTSTSATVAVASGAYSPKESWDEDFPAQSVRFEDVLYRTAKGALFIHKHKTLKFDKGKPVVSDAAEAMKPMDALRWIESSGARILDPTGLPLPDEA